MYNSLIEQLENGVWTGDSRLCVRYVFMACCRVCSDGHTMLIRGQGRQAEKPHYYSRQ